MLFRFGNSGFAFSLSQCLADTNGVDIFAAVACLPLANKNLYTMKFIDKKCFFFSSPHDAR